MKSNSYTQGDVIVIGSGGAGIMAAIYAARYGGKVILLEKGVYGRSGCTILGGYSCNAALGNTNPNDNPAVHEADTLKAGCFINDRNLVRVFVEEAPKCVLELAEFGVRFNTKNGKLDQGLTPGNTYPRSCFSDFRTGQMMMSGLRREVKNHKNIIVHDGVIVTNLIKNDHRIVGVESVHWSTGEPHSYLANAIVIATGGSAQLYERSTVSVDNTGDGMVLALSAGASLQDLEFVQFLPFVMCYPHSLGLNPGTGEGLRFVDVHMTNNMGEAFIDKEIPNWLNTATRDVLAQMLYKEIRDGRASPHGGLYLSVAHNPDEVIRDNLGTLYTSLLSQGVDLTQDTIEVAPAAHYHMGGIHIDENGWTGIKGLYAAGEVTAGVHGANRLAGNALSEILVFGARAGKAASEFVNSMKSDQAKELKTEPIFQKIKFDPQGLRPATLKSRIQRIMWKNCGIIRDHDGLEQAKQDLERASSETESLLAISSPISVYNREILDLLEVKSMVLLAQAIVESALARKESRGAHYRSDFPEIDDEQYKGNLMVRLNGKGFDLNLQPIKNKSISGESR